LQNNSIVFSPAKIGALEISNRIVRSATWEAMADKNGFISDKYIELYKQLALGGAGLIISGFLFTTPQGKGPMGMAGISSDEHISGLRKMTDAVHKKGGKIIAQLAHCGRRVAPPLKPAVVASDTDTEDILSGEEIEKIIQDFAQAARRAKKAGFDGVQFHCAHGYLLSDFLSPLSNSRRDSWGQTPQGRFSIVAKILNKTRDLVGANYPILLKINGSDNISGGVDPELCTRYVKMAKENGTDAVEISAGVPEAGFTTIRGDIPLIMFTKGRTDQESVQMAQKKIESLKGISSFKPCYNRDFALAVKRKLPEMTVISVGGYRTISDMEETLKQNAADLISLSRPLIMEPDLPNKIKNGETTKSKCINCNICLSYAPIRGLRCFYGKEPDI